MSHTEAETHRDSPVQALLERLHRDHLEDRSGDVASYIPELAKADPDWFGICLVTAGGAVYEVGETRHEFTIQSISKPLTFALALEAIGEPAVREHVDVEPSGDAFNSITLTGSGIPPNPMVNAGAIATASLVRPLGSEQPIERIVSEYSAFAGRDLEIDEQVYRSEDASGYRNRAIAYLMKNSGALPEEAEVEEVVETYFRQCSTLVNCRDLAIMAATLASSGVNPVSRERVLREDTVQNVLSVMATCGMYDAAGDWVYNVGLPAKSGVAGGIIAALPGQFGIAVYSPPLDEHGNSVRGIEVCEDLSRKLHLHVMSPPRRPAPPIRSLRTSLESRSKRIRPEAEIVVLEEYGERVRAIELQGEIWFAASELISSAVLSDHEEVDFLVLDFGSVRGVDPVVFPIISDLAEAFEARDGHLVFSGIEKHPVFAEALAERRKEHGLSEARILPDFDRALEWAEERILELYGDFPETEEIALADHRATDGMDEGHIEILEALLERREYSAGDGIYAEDEQVREVLLLVKGKISILTTNSDGNTQRLATISAGDTIGEVAMLSGERRIGYSRADEDVVAYSLGADGYRQLQEHPPVVNPLLQNLLRMVAVRFSHMGRHLVN
jgi:glutaminase